MVNVRRELQKKKEESWGVVQDKGMTFIDPGFWAGSIR